MKIFFERSGGFAGLSLRTKIDTNELPPQEADPLKEMVYRSKFFELPHELSSEQGADRFTYRLTVEDAGNTHTVEMKGAAVPDEIQPLLQELTTLARTRR